MKRTVDALTGVIVPAQKTSSATVRRTGRVSDAKKSDARAKIERRQCAGIFDLQNSIGDSCSAIAALSRAFPP